MVSLAAGSFRASCYLQPGMEAPTPRLARIRSDDGGERNETSFAVYVPTSKRLHVGHFLTVALVQSMALR